MSQIYFNRPKTEKIDVWNVGKIVLFALIISTIMFLLFDAFLGEFLQSTILEYQSDLSRDDLEFLVVVITNMGFVLSALACLLSIMLSQDVLDKKTVYLLSILAMVINIIIWYFISWITLIIMHKELFMNVGMIANLVQFPMFLAYFSAFYLAKVTYLWIYSQFSFYGIVYLLILLKAQQEAKKDVRTTFSWRK